MCVRCDKVEEANPKKAWPVGDDYKARF